MGSRSCVLVMTLASAACMPMQSRNGGGGGGGGGGGDAPREATFHCAGGVCYTSAQACASSGIQLGAGFQTSCTTSEVAWCTGEDRARCSPDEATCSQRFASPCVRIEGPPPPPPPPPHRPDGPPEVLAVLATSATDATLRPIYCRYIDGALDAAAPAHLCPAAAADMPATTLDPQQSGAAAWSLRVVVDELLADSVGAQRCDGALCGRQLFEGMIALTCEGATFGVAGWYQDGGDRGSTPPGPSILVVPRSGYPLPAGSTCALVLSDGLVDASGEAVPPTQRSVTLVVAGP